MELLLGGLGLATAVCLLSIFRLRSRYARLAERNAALAEHAAQSVRSNRAKRRFVASLTHELRTPLNVIVGFAELMCEQRLGPLAEEHQECIEDIHASAHHMLDLVNEALDMARIESGRVSLHPRPVDPAHLVAECVESMRSLAGENEVTVSVQAPPLDIALLDPARLRQVVLNYLSNAIKFTPPGGVIVVRAARLRRDLLVEVTDTGCGIEPEQQRRVFDEFEQLDGGYRGGTGLGLAVTKQIVEAHGGAVGVQSEPGKGSTFSARLPLTPATATPAPRILVPTSA
jgi:two-component system cell cycle sensor histidine kinase PleC